MKLIVWNCKGAAQRKLGHMHALQPHLLVVPECGNADNLGEALSDPAPTSQDWIGDNPHKGLGVFAYGGYRLTRSPLYDDRFRYVLPLEVSGPFDFLLVAVWTLPMGGSYVRPLAEALAGWLEQLQGRSVIIAGDFNANYVFDKPSRAYTFRDVVERLAASGIHSVYHEWSGEVHGEESRDTFYLYHHQNRPFHLDYVFASSDLLDRVMSFDVGQYDEWRKRSDHVPLTVQFA